jgi:hypothetical protein
MDLAHERDFTVSIGWGQPSQYIRLGGITDQIPFLDAALPAASTANGVVQVVVLNELTVPSDTGDNDITVNVFVSTGDDIQYYSPSSDISSLSPLQPQSSEYEPQSDESENPNESAPVEASAIQGILSRSKTTDAVIFGGERLMHLRTLLKRFDYYTTLVPPDATLASGSLMFFRLQDFPSYRGITPTGLHQTDEATPRACNYVNNTLLAFYAAAFAAYRGALRRTYVLHCGNDINGLVRIARNGQSSTEIRCSADTRPSPRRLYEQMKYDPTIMSGGTFVTTNVNNVITFETPYYKDSRFSPIRQLDRSDNWGIASTHDLLVSLLGPFTSDLTQVSLDTYISIGEDFSYFFFLGLPPLFESRVSDMPIPPGANVNFYNPSYIV